MPAGRQVIKNATKNPQAILGVEEIDESVEIGEAHHAMSSIDRCQQASGIARNRFRGVTRSTFAASSRRNRQIGLVFPLAGPSLTRPSLQRNGTDGRPVFVSDHFTPSTGVGSANLRRAFTHAEKTLTAGGQTSHRAPVLSAI